MKILYIDCTQGCHEHDLACALKQTVPVNVIEETESVQNIRRILKDAVISDQSLTDIMTVCNAIEQLQPERIYVSTVTAGHHLSEDMTAFLKDMSFRCGDSESPLITTVSIALLKYWGSVFGEDPVFTLEKAGYGENGLCVMVGEMKEDGSIVELTCNIDDMSPEAVGHAMKVLFEAGALDVYTLNAGMKKNRPGLVFTCMCRRADRERILKLMFTHLSTLGIRESTCIRHSMHRQVKSVHTGYGDVRIKYSQGYGAAREKIEYEDLARIAEETGKGIEEIRKELIEELSR